MHGPGPGQALPRSAADTEEGARDPQHGHHVLDGRVDIPHVGENGGGQHLERQLGSHSPSRVVSEVAVVFLALGACMWRLIGRRHVEA